jgi:ABC-type antimicrobial peptide transport system permease subunit
LLLAAGGLHSLLSYNVRCRTREIGVRIALGASRRQIVWLVVAPGVTVALMGGLVGTVGAWAGATVIRSALLGVSAFHVWSVVPGLALLIAVSAAAGMIPAFRATAIQPATALRYE